MPDTFAALGMSSSLASVIGEACFPPNILTNEDKSRIITGWCDNFSKDNVEEVACKVCGELHLKLLTVLYKDVNFDTALLCPSTWEKHGVVAQENKRSSKNREALTFDKPVLLKHSEHICISC